MVNTSTDNLTVSTKLTLSPGAAVSGLTVEHVQGLQKGLERKPNSHSPAFTGVPTAPTATSGTNTTQIATTQFVKTALDNLSGDAPALLNTLNELANALGDDANFATTVTTSLGLKAPLANPTFTGTVGGISKAMVGLGNVDNTSDANKPVSTATQTALDLKASLSGATFTGTVNGITATMVGLGSVNNTSDAAKPISTATQTALDAKASLSGATFTGTVNGITATMVGLGSVNNTSDANKPVSTATQTALDLKAPLANPAFTGTVTGISKSMVDLSNVDNTSDANKPVSTATQNALDLKASLASPSLTGTPTAPTASVGTNNTQIATTEFVASAVADLLGADVLPALDTLKELATALNNDADFAGTVTTALAAKAPSASPTFTGTVTFENIDSLTGLTKSMVGLENVDNTSDAAKVSSGAIKDALDAKASTTALSSAISTEVSDRNSAISTAITNEGTARDAAISTAITNEGTARDAAISTAISALTPASVGLGNVDNTSDADKVSSGAIKDALDAKASLSGATFTGTVSGITAAMVGFSINLDNKLEVSIGGATYRFAPTHINGVAQ
jgi:hypothetical protein